MLTFHILRVRRKLTKHSSIMAKSKHIAPLRSDSILFVGMVDSPHFQKWVENYMMEFPNMKISIFPSDRPRGANAVFLGKKMDRENLFQFRFSRIRVLNFILFKTLDKILGLSWRAYFLAKVIQKKKPITIHFHETQHSAYIYNLIACYKRIPSNTLKILSTWGSDLILYSKFESHHSNILASMSWVDILTAERREDFQIAQKFGFDGEFVAPIYITVGSEIDNFRHPNPSMRKIVLIKGYQDLPGRALNALDVVSRIGRSFPEVKFLVYSAAKSVKIRVSQIKTEFGIDISIIERVSKQEMDNYFSQARVAISLAISDGLPGSLVEAMRAGAFPIQSLNSAGPNMIINGESGFLVNPEDIDEIKKALICALEDDELVDSAYEKNICTLKKKYSFVEGRKVLRSIYTMLR